MAVALVRTGDGALISVGVARRVRKLNLRMMASLGRHGAYRGDAKTSDGISDCIAAGVGYRVIAHHGCSSADGDEKADHDCSLTWHKVYLPSSPFLASFFCVSGSA